MSEKPHLLVIAYGNSLRRDDGAGLALAEQLVTQWQNAGIAVRQRLLHQLTPELALTISTPAVERVLFVDTAASSDGSVTLQPIVPDQSGRVVGHHLTPASLLLYADRLYQRCPPAWLLTIPGSDFGFGEGFSVTTAEYLNDCRAMAGELLRKMAL